MGKIFRFLRTIFYVPVPQLWARVVARAKKYYYLTPFYPLFLEREEGAPELSLQPARLWAGDKIKGEMLAERHEFNFVGRVISMENSVRWQPAEASLLWQFNLHYWDWLADLHQAKRQDKALQLVEDWLLECDSYTPVAWHPYPISLRLVNGFIYGKWLLNGAKPELVEAYWGSLQRQATHLANNLEHDLGGNHLIKNLKALMLAGVCLPGRQSLFLEGQNRLLKELKIQIMPDGGHYERSPLYHVQVLADLLEIHALLHKAKLRIPPLLDEILDKMAEVLAFYRYPDGRLALMNDSAEGSKKYLDAIAKRCGANLKAGYELPNVGYVRLQKGAITAMVDCGKIINNGLPGHSHAQSACFEMCVGKERVFVNSGTYAYQDSRRNFLRGTIAHNTVSVDGENSAEVWGEFRVGRRPKKVESEFNKAKSGSQTVITSHDGFRHLGVTHKRSMALAADGNNLQGIDEITGSGNRRVKAYFHLHPAVKCKLKDEQHAELILASGKVVALAITGGRLYVQDSIYSPQFGKLEENKQLVVQGNWRKNSCKIEWLITVQS